MRYLLLLAGGLFLAGPVQAVDTPWGSDCVYSEKDTIITFPAGIKMTIDPTLPVGTVFFEHLVNPEISGALSCSSELSYTIQQQYAYEATGSYVMMSGYGLSSDTGSYPVYKTNIPGIGIVVRSGNSAFPVTYAKLSESNKKLNTRWGSKFDIDIIKYANIPVGGSTININSIDLPVINRNLIVSASSDPTKLREGKVTLQRLIMSDATFNIVSSTCDTPDIAVNLGKRKVLDTLNREGGQFASPWVDASIQLTGCPVFYGTGERSSTLKSITRNNILTLTIQPNNATTSREGVMPVDKTDESAQGIGIQLAYGTAAAQQPVDFSTGQATAQYTMSPTQGSTYTIPLVARYKQTATNLSDIRPGQASGKITYLINYF